MEEIKKEGTKKPEPLSYERLKEIAGQLQQQNMQLRTALQKTEKIIQENNYEYMLDRLHCLFDVLKYEHMFDEEFVTYCVNEIKAAILPPKKDEEEENPESKEE